MAESIRNEVNRIDREVGMKFFAKHGMLTLDGQPNELARKFLRVEKIADTVDRAMSPVSAEEFNKIMDPASMWLKDEADKKIAAKLERDFARFTSGLSFDDAKDFYFTKNVLKNLPALNSRHFCSEFFSTFHNCPRKKILPLSCFHSALGFSKMSISNGRCTRDKGQTEKSD